VHAAVHAIVQRNCLQCILVTSADLLVCLLQAMLGVYTLPTRGDGMISFATQLTAPHLAHLWVPSAERDVLLPAATFVAAAAAASAMLRTDKPHRRTALAGWQPTLAARSCCRQRICPLVIHFVCLCRRSHLATCC